MSNSTATILMVLGFVLTNLAIYILYTTEMRKNNADVKVKKDVEGR